MAYMDFLLPFCLSALSKGYEVLKPYQEVTSLSGINTYPSVLKAHLLGIVWVVVVAYDAGAIWEWWETVEALDGRTDASPGSHPFGGCRNPKLSPLLFTYTV